MSYRYSNTDRKNIAWMKNDDSVATLLQIKLARGMLRGLHPFSLKLEYPIAAIAGENGTGKSTLLAMAACAYHNKTDGYLPIGRKKPYFTFSDFFIQSHGETPPQGINLGYQILYNNWRGGKAGALWQSRKKRVGGKWNNYDKRVRRNVVYFGVQRVVPHYERSTHKSYRVRFRNDSLDEEHRQKICTIASRILGKTYDTFEKHTHSKYYLPVATCGDVRYSGFNMGAGESAVFEILMALFEAGKGSLLIIDELELGLHERAQIRFVHELKKLCKELHCQVICSTHSHVVLNALPPEGRFFLETTNNRTLVTSQVSPDYACGKLRGSNVGELDVFVEDDVAASILELGIPHHLRQRVKIVPIGSSNAVIRMMASRYLEGKDSCLYVLDGDKRSVHASNISRFREYAENRFRKSKKEMECWAKQRLTYLPSKETPERWLVTSCKKIKEKSSLAQTWRLQDAGILEDWLDNALREPTHSEFYALSQESQLPEDRIIGDLLRFLLSSKPKTLDDISNRIDDLLSE